MRGIARLAFLSCLFIVMVVAMFVAVPVWGISEFVRVIGKILDHVGDRMADAVIETMDGLRAFAERQRRGS